MIAPSVAHQPDTSIPRRRSCKEMGLIGYVVPDGSALEKALEIAEVINNNGPLAVQAILKTIHETEAGTRTTPSRSTPR
jgi:enoyl-CoA hydratase/carnithine racemase